MQFSREIWGFPLHCPISGCTLFAMSTRLSQDRDLVMEATVSARVPVDLKDRILRMAAQEDRSEGYVVRRLLKAALGLGDPRPDGNGVDQAEAAVA
jgi:hypothetical protein